MRYKRRGSSLNQTEKVVAEQINNTPQTSYWPPYGKLQIYFDSTRTNTKDWNKTW